MDAIDYDAGTSNGSGGTLLLKMVVVDSYGGCSGSDDDVCGRWWVWVLDDSGSVGGRRKLRGWW